MQLYHFTDKSNKESILENGLNTSTKFEIFTPIRENVVFCWLNIKDNKIKKNNQIWLKVNVDEERCLIADMDYISMAMMYNEKYAKEDGIAKKPVNQKAESLFVQLYEATAVKPQNYYNGMHFSPEVLVKGDIKKSDIEIC